MGLDSVELVMAVEDTFGIAIPDAEAEEIITVQHFADSVYQKISISTSEKCLKQVIFYRLRRALQNLGFEYERIKPETKISELFSTSELKTSWMELERKLSLKLPELVALDFNPNLDSHLKIFGIKTLKRTLPVSKGTIRKLVDWIISINFEEVIDINQIANKYEIERIVCALISEKIGVPISEIEMNHSITNDLGID